MNTKRKKTGRKLLSFLLTLAMVVVLMPGMSLMALAWDGDPYAELLNTTTAVNFDGKEWYLIENNSTAVDAGTVTLLSKECVAASQYNSSGSYVEYASSTVKTAVDNWYNNNITSNAKTAVFDNKMFLLTKDQANAMTTDTRKCSQASEANYNYWWLCSPGSFGNFASCVYGGNGNVLAYGYSVVCALGVRPALKLNLSSVIFSSESKTFTVGSAASYSVIVTAGSNMTKTETSGAASQTDLSGTMTDVVYTADDGYYFPTDYSVATVNGISVTRNSYTQITVSGTPTADASITLTAPTAKTTPDAPTTVTVVNCTTADNNDGKLTGVTAAMEYKKSDAESWTAGTGSDITGLVPGTYYVRVKATDTTLASDNQELTIKGFISYTVTFKVMNGSWNDETTADKTVTLTGYEGDTLKLTADQIPAVGSKPNDTYKAGSWDVEPSTDTAITAATSYTYTYAAKEAAVVTKAPEAKTLTYNGSAQELVTAGTATGGTMQYALGDANGATQPYTTSIPTATDAGTYYVWYKVAGDENHNDTNPACVEVTINKATPTYTAPIGLTATYGDTLSGVTLPTGWAWVDSTQSVGNVGTNTFKANFTPADINNFNTISGIDVKVTVGKTAGKTAVISTDTMTYNYSSIYIEGVEGQEYIIVPKGTAVTDADWNTSVKPDPERDNWVFFENLKEATEYEIYARTAETETTLAGEAVKANVYTTLSSIGYDYDSTLVGASITVEPEPNVEGLTYKWYQDEVTEDGEGAIHHNLTEIPGATGSTYTFRAEDAGKNIAVKIFSGDSEVGDVATDTPVALTAKVIFDSKGGSDVETLTDVVYQSKIKAPADPTREGFAFDGWYWDEEFETPFDFEKDVITWTETTLYAKWTPNDYKITSVTGLTGANNNQWAKGTKDGVVITVKVSGEDNSFDHFTGVKLDGKELVKDVDYTVEKGSTIVTLKPETLEKLSVGEHTVTVLFDNGEVNTTLTVLAANSQDATSPQTGDNSHMGLWIALMMLSLLGIAATLLFGRKKRVFDR